VVRVKNYGGDAGNNLVAVIGVQMVTNTMRFQERAGVTIPDKAASANELVSDAKLLYEMGKFDEAETRLKSALTLEPENQAAHYYMNLVLAGKANRRTGMIQTSAARKIILDELNRIRFDQFGPYNRRPLSEVIQELNQLTTRLASDKTAIHFFTADSSNGGQPVIDPNTGLPAEGAGSKGVDMDSVTVSFSRALTNLTLANVLDVIVMTANKPIQYSVSGEGIVFSPKMEAPQLFSRTFQVDAHGFPDALRNITGLQTNSVSTMARSLFSKCGVDLEPPESVFYTDRLGLLFVRATMEHLDTIERAIQALNLVAPQIHIKARFLEVPKGTLNGFGFAKIIGITNQPDELAGILTRENAAVTIRMLESRPGIEELAEPEVTTSSGRQTEMRATQIITVITNFVFKENIDTPRSSSITPQSTKVETGPILDVVPYALSDGYTIFLTVIPSLTEFLGYDQPPTKPTEHINNFGDHVPGIPVILPSFGIHKTSAHIKLWDGQTVVLGPLKTRFYDGGKEVGTEPDYFVKTKAAKGQPNEEDKDVLVLITVTLVDPAGNRIHSDEEMPFAEKSVPPQGGL